MWYNACDLETRSASEEEFLTSEAVQAFPGYEFVWPLGCSLLLTLYTRERVHPPA